MYESRQYNIYKDTTLVLDNKAIKDLNVGGTGSLQAKVKITSIGLVNNGQDDIFKARLLVIEASKIEK